MAVLIVILLFAMQKKSPASDAGRASNSEFNDRLRSHRFRSHDPRRFAMVVYNQDIERRPLAKAR